MGCEWPISSYVFRRMMTSIPVTKHSLVYAFAEEAATNFKMLQLACIGQFRCSSANFEGIIPKKTLKCGFVLLYQSDMTHLCHA